MISYVGAPEFRKGMGLGVVPELESYPFERYCTPGKRKDYGIEKYKFVS